ncbi:MAG: hypothetical protein ABR514_03610 [Chthoniobacterales bacterium]
MSVRVFIAVGVALLIVNIVCAGEYQRATDAKTLVWNNDPKPDDAASWSGKTDKEGYATGSGTLTWYRVERAKKTGSNLPTDKRIPISSYSGTMVRGKLNGPVIAADPSGKFFHGTFANGRRSGDWTEGAPRVRRGELVEAAAPAEGPSRSKIETAATPTTTRQETDQPQMVETTAPAAPAGGNTPQVSDSLRSLALPPASLRTDAAAASATTAPSGPEAGSATATDGGRNAAEVIELADAEARAGGYNLDQYQRPQVQYSTDGETWSVSYVPKTGTTKGFNVTIDRQKKAEVKK